MRQRPAMVEPVRSKVSQVLAVCSTCSKTSGIDCANKAMSTCGTL